MPRLKGRYSGLVAAIENRTFNPFSIHTSARGHTHTHMRVYTRVLCVLESDVHILTIGLMKSTDRTSIKQSIPLDRFPSIPLTMRREPMNRVMRFRRTSESVRRGNAVLEKKQKPQVRSHIATRCHHPWYIVSKSEFFLEQDRVEKGEDWYPEGDEKGWIS